MSLSEVYVNSFRRSGSKLLLTTFYDFLTHHFKNVKSHIFLKSEKYVKYVFSNTDTQQADLRCQCLVWIHHWVVLSDIYGYRITTAADRQRLRRAFRAGLYPADWHYRAAGRYRRWRRALWTNTNERAPHPTRTVAEHHAPTNHMDSAAKCITIHSER